MFPQVGHERCAQNYQLFVEGTESPERADRLALERKPLPRPTWRPEGAVVIQIRSEPVQGGERCARNYQLFAQNPGAAISG